MYPAVPSTAMTHSLCTIYTDILQLLHWLYNYELIRKLDSSTSLFLDQDLYWNLPLKFSAPVTNVPLATTEHLFFLCRPPEVPAFLLVSQFIHLDYSLLFQNTGVVEK